MLRVEARHIAELARTAPGHARNRAWNLQAEGLGASVCPGKPLDGFWAVVYACEYAGVPA